MRAVDRVVGGPHRDAFVSALDPGPGGSRPIVTRSSALLSDGRVVAVRAEDLPDGAHAAALLRYVR